MRPTVATGWLDSSPMSNDGGLAVDVVLMSHVYSGVQPISSTAAIATTGRLMRLATTRAYSDPVVALGWTKVQFPRRGDERSPGCRGPA